MIEICMGKLKQLLINIVHSYLTVLTFDICITTASLFSQVNAVCQHISKGKTFVGIKKLLGLLDNMRVMRNESSKKRVEAFCELLEDEGIYQPSPQ